jgi:hypothetical protein
MTSPGGHLEQSSDEFSLCPDVAAAINVSKLPFPHHRHRLIACECSSGRPEAAKTKPWTGQSFHVPMLLFEDILQGHCQVNRDWRVEVGQGKLPL